MAFPPPFFFFLNSQPSSLLAMMTIIPHSTNHIEKHYIHHNQIHVMFSCFVHILVREQILLLIHLVGQVINFSADFLSASCLIIQYLKV